MKSPLLAALLLTGCATQPSVMPTAPVETAQDLCIGHFAAMAAFAMVSEPVLDDCLAGQHGKCQVFARFLLANNPTSEVEQAKYCLDSGAISVYHPVVKPAITAAKRLGPKMAKFSARFGK